MLLRCSGQLRTTHATVIGIDVSAALQLGEALGYDLRQLAELLPGGEAGMINGLKQEVSMNAADEL